MERESFDLMGLSYTGHPDLRRIMLPWDWVGHPLRKDQPLGGEEVPFSMTWNDPDFAALGSQIMDPAPVQAPLPRGVDCPSTCSSTWGRIIQPLTAYCASP